MLIVSDTVFSTANQIGVNGAAAMADALTANTGLTALDLGGRCCRVLIKYLTVVSHSFSVNHIGDDGGKAMGEALKYNTTLKELNLRGMLSNLITQRHV